MTASLEQESDPMQRLLRHFEGWTDNNQVHHKGLNERMTSLEELERKREEDRKAREANRLFSRNGVLIAAAGVAFTQAVSWIQAHWK